MNQNEFDNKIRASLESVEVPYDPDSWNLLETRMDLSNNESVAGFDSGIKSALERLETPYDSELWRLMARQLNQSAAIRKVRIRKLAEAAVILLLALQISANFTPDTFPEKPGIDPTPAIVPVNSPMAGSVRQGKITANTIAAFNAATARPYSTVDPESDPLLNITPAFVENSSTPENLPLVPTRILAVPLRSFPLTELELLATRACVNQSSGKWYLAAFSEAGADFVRPNAQSSFSALSPGFGIIVGKEAGKWGFETGLQVNTASFTPDNKTSVYAGNPQTGFLASYITGADATTVAVPVRVTRKIATTRAVELRALAGLAAEMVAEKSYSRRTVFLPPAGQSTGGAGMPTGNIPDKIQNGLFEGGRAINNVTASALLGLRISAKLGNSYSIFLEPVASINLSGSWGPEQEKIDRFSVRAGVHARL